MMRAISLLGRRGFHVMGLLATLVLSACGSGGTGDGNTLASLAITDTSFQRPAGNFETFQCLPGELRVVGTFDDGSQEDLTLRATWTSDTPGAVRVGDTLCRGDDRDPPNCVTDKGRLTPAGAIGATATIRAEFVSLSASTGVIVRPGNIEISPTLPNIAQGTVLQMFATAILGGDGLGDGTFNSDGSNRAFGFNNGVIWESTNTAVATISNATPTNSSHGVVTPIAPGTTTIRARAGIACPTPLDAETVLTVNDEDLVTISLQSATLPFDLNDIGRNTRAILRLIGNYSNGFRQDLTGLASLVSDTPTTIAVFSGFLVQSQATSGSSVLTARFDPDGGGALAPVMTNTTATINDNKRLMANGLSISTNPVSPSPVTLLAGTFADLDAIGTYIDPDNGNAQSQQNLYRDVTWAMVPADTAVATVTGIGRVIASATTTGTADITAARLDPVPPTATFTSTRAVRVEPFTATPIMGLPPGNLAVTCPEPVPAGTAADCTAILTFTGAAGGSTQDVSLFVLWNSSAPAVADISNARNSLLNELRKTELGRSIALAGRVYGASNSGSTTITAALFDNNGVLLASGTDSINNSLSPGPDTDSDGTPDATDTDDDNDGDPDTADNCPLMANPDQADSPDMDGQGNVCDTDDDNDTVADTSDNCPINANTDQLNSDNVNDGGNACDADDDNDGVADTGDACPTEPTNGVASSRGTGCPCTTPLGNVCLVP